MLVITNLLLIIFTFGVGTPWAIVRSMNFIIENITLPEQIVFNNIKQTEDEYTDLTGDDVMEFLVTGATAVQIGTANYYDPTVSQKLAAALPAALAELGATSVREVVGTLQTK